MPYYNKTNSKQRPQFKIVVNKEIGEIFNVTGVYLPPVFSFPIPLFDTVDLGLDLDTLSYNLSMTGTPFTDAALVGDVLSIYHTITSRQVSSAVSTDTLIVEFSGPINDAYGAAETIRVAYTGFRTFTDTATLAEETIFDVTKGLADSTSVSDVLVTEWSAYLSLTDTATVAEETIFDVTKPLADSGSASDVLSRIWTSHFPLTDTALSVEETTLNVSKISTDTYTASDVLATEWSAYLALTDTAQIQDLVGIPDGATYQFIKTISDTVRVTDQLLRVLDADGGVVDQANIADNLAYDMARGTSDSYDVSDALNITLGRSFFDQVGIIDELDITWTASLSEVDTITASDVLSTVWTAVLPIVDTATTDDTGHTFNVIKQLYDKPVVGDSLVALHSAFRNFNDSVTTKNPLSWNINKHVVDTSTLSDSILTSHDAFRIFADEAHSTDDGVAFNVIKEFYDKPVVSDVISIAVAASGILYDTANVKESVILGINKGITDTTNTFDEIGIVGQFSRKLSDAALSQDLVGVPDGATWEFIKTVNELVNKINDVAVVHSNKSHSDSVGTDDIGALIQRSYFASDYVEFTPEDQTDAYDAVLQQPI